MNKPRQLVFIPSVGVGHLISAVEMANLLVSRDDNLFITFLIMKLPFDSKGTEAYIASLETTSMLSPRVNFITLPQAASDLDIRSSPNAFRNQFVESHKPHAKHAVTKLAESQTTRLAGFVIDMFCTTMIDVANEFGVPTYMFFTSPAGFLGLLLNLQTIRSVYGKDVSEFKDSDSELALSTFANSVPAKVLPSVLLDKEGAEAFLSYAKRFSETKGILVNTFVELESHALDSISDGEIEGTPPVYPVGPIMNLKSGDTKVGSDQAQQKSDILEWLDDRPASSVVFLCFGSRGSFGEAQVREIAYGLEQSRVRFLWSLRQPPPMGTIASPTDYKDPKGVLPEGFLDRTAGIGKVIGWAPQVAILAHPAVGGFVSHCGWNSTLESLWFGVPVATWPVYAEQQLNAFELVRELGLAVEIDMGYRRDFYGESPNIVRAEEIERGIREVMELDSDVRTRVKKMSQESKKALMEGGSSYSLLGRFLEQIFLR